MGSIGGLIKIILAVIGVIGTVATTAFVVKMDLQDKEQPSIEIKSELYANVDNKAVVTAKDASGIKELKVKFSDGLNETILFEKVYDGELEKELSVNIEIPQKFDGKPMLIVEALDGSGGIFSGNRVRVEKEISVDLEAPEIKVISQSFRIYNGTSAFVIFKATDPNLDTVEVVSNKGKRFKATPFIQKDYFAAFVSSAPWDTDFRASIIAKDTAGNTNRYNIEFDKKVQEFKKTKFNVTDPLINGVITRVAGDFTGKGLDKFIYVNEELRDESNKEVFKANARWKNAFVEDFDLAVFDPVSITKKSDNFAVESTFVYKGKEISRGWHLGTDFSANKNAEVYVSNPGVVSFAGENGIYGNMVVINHGFGISSMYAHLSQINVREGQIVRGGEVLGNIGQTGFALGEHLHFAMVVNGVFVKPEDFTNGVWIEENIKDVIAAAKRQILK